MKIKLPQIPKEELLFFIINKFQMTTDEAMDYITEFPNRATWWYWKTKVDAMDKNEPKK